MKPSYYNHPRNVLISQASRKLMAGMLTSLLVDLYRHFPYVIHILRYGTMRKHRKHIPEADPPSFSRHICIIPKATVLPALLLVVEKAMQTPNLILLDFMFSSPHQKRPRRTSSLCTD